MTADDLEARAVRFGRVGWCRHWLHWNDPDQNPWLMAISCLDLDGTPARTGLQERGFTRVDHEGLIVYTIPRTDESGAPYRSGTGPYRRGGRAR